MTALYKQFFAHQSACIHLALIAVAALPVLVHAEDYDKSFGVSSRANVRVHTNDGNVRIVPGDAQQVSFHVMYSNLALGKTLQIESHQQGDEVQLTARIVSKLHSLRPPAQLDIEVRMPKNGDLRVESGDGSIKVDGLSGTVDLHSGDGSLVVNALAGDVRLHTGDGSIDASDLDGMCVAASRDGHIRIAGRFDGLAAQSGDGRINVSALPGSRLNSSWSIGSGDGNIDVALPKDLSVDIDARTRDGHITTNIPITLEGSVHKRRLRGKMNGGGETLTIHSGDGAIHLNYS